MRGIICLTLAIILALTSALPVIAITPNSSNTFSCADVHEITSTECEALVALYNSTNGPGWLYNNNWLVNSTPSTWAGLFVNESHVTAMYLDYYGLTGSLPSELGLLGNLDELHLESNQLSGVIPPELGNIQSMIWLDLSHNQLSGGIPPELGSMANLQYLYLGNNQLSGGIPPELGSMANLQYLYLGNNQLSGSIPPELGSLVNLLVLALNNNHLSGGIPPELGSLINLVYLELNHNQLNGSILPVLGSLVNLQDLSLDHNQLSGGIPPELGELSLLRILRLNNNYLEGDIPDTFVNLTSLYDPGMIWDGGDGLDLDYNLLNVPPNYPDPSDILQLFLNQKDPDWQLYQGFEQVIGAGGGELTSLDGRADFLIPEGALISDITFTFIPQPEASHSHFGLSLAHNSFLLTAEDVNGDPITAFNSPLTTTITYANADFGGMEEALLGLYYWDEGASTWKDAVTTCPGGVYTRDLNANLLALPLCHLTEFGLFGEPLHIFLPVIIR